VQRIDVRSAQQMHDAVLRDAASNHVFIATAAVADWRPASAAAQKIKKQADGTVPEFAAGVAMVENPDILATVARLPVAPYCVGFAAESHDLIRHAREKRQRKGVPLIVANLGPATFGADDNQLVLVDEHGERELPRAAKLVLARQVVDEIATRLAAART
jgi:phosphopantothenoylcysteine decarboxylase / phosphopantothenate---cysteine ligase